MQITFPTTVGYSTVVDLELDAVRLDTVRVNYEMVEIRWKFGVKKGAVSLCHIYNVD